MAWALAAVGDDGRHPVGPSQGVDWTLSLLLIKALAIAILGGLDSIGGVLLAGLIVGVCRRPRVRLLDPLVGGGTRDWSSPRSSSSPS